MGNNIKEPRAGGVIKSKEYQAASIDENAGRWVLATTILGSSLTFIDGTVVKIALPILQ